MTEPDITRSEDAVHPEWFDEDGEPDATLLHTDHGERDRLLGQHVTAVVRQRDDLRDILGTVLATVLHEKNRKHFPQDFAGWCDRWKAKMHETLGTKP